MLKCPKQIEKIDYIFVNTPFIQLQVPNKTQAINSHSSILHKTYQVMPNEIHANASWFIYMKVDLIYDNW